MNPTTPPAATPTLYRVGSEPAMCEREVNDPKDMHWPVFDQHYGCVAHVFGKGDANITADALNTFHATGLSPSALAQRCAELEKAMEGMLPIIDRCIPHLSQMPAYRRYRDVLAKTAQSETGKGAQE